MTVHSLDAPRVSRRVVLPLHRATPNAIQTVIRRLEEELAPESAKLPSPRRQFVYITYEEVAEWPLLQPPSPAA